MCHVTSRPLYLEIDERAAGGNALPSQNTKLTLSLCVDFIFAFHPERREGSSRLSYVSSSRRAF